MLVFLGCIHPNPIVVCLNGKWDVFGLDSAMFFRFGQVLNGILVEPSGELMKSDVH